MSRRIRPTHRLSVTRFGTIECDGNGDCPEQADRCEDGVCVDELGEPIEGEQSVVEDVPVAFDPDGDTVRDEAGAVVQRTPTITGPGTLVTQLEETDDVDLEPITDGAQAYHGLDIRSVEPVHGRRSRPVKATIYVEG